MNILIEDTNIEDLQRAMLMFSGHVIHEIFEHGDLIDKEEHVKHGRWIEDLIIAEQRDYVITYCSECGFGKNQTDKRRYRFCPECGAKMDEIGGRIDNEG